MKDVKDTDYSKWTREDFIFHHRKMWNWIADQTLKLKRKVDKLEYFRAMRTSVNYRPLHLCYCCEFTAVLDKNGTIRPICRRCPIDWKSNALDYMCECNSNMDDGDGLFTIWLDTYDYKESAIVARTIANLPEVENV